MNSVDTQVKRSSWSIWVQLGVGLCHGEWFGGVLSPPVHRASSVAVKGPTEHRSFEIFKDSNTMESSCLKPVRRASDRCYAYYRQRNEFDSDSSDRPQWVAGKLACSTLVLCSSCGSSPQDCP